MTPEKQNEIWATLPSWFRRQLMDEYDDAKLALSLDPNNPRIQSHICFLECYFGLHNLTVQAGEKPKKGLLDRIIDAGYNFLDRHNPDVISERGTSNIDYAQYRLDLAKEIAVAMIPTYVNEYSLSEMGEIAVETANEIVKRLKETEG